MTDEYPRQYAAAVDPPTPHPDYAPNGIAPRLGHALLRLAAAPDATSDVRGLSRGIVESGRHDHLPILADALEEAGHPAADWFDWRHADRGVAIDKALFSQIVGKRRRRAEGGTEPISPGWIMADWKERARGQLPQRKALDAVRKTVPDATNEDISHSLVRLHDIQHGIVPNLEHEERWIREAEAQHLRNIATLPLDMIPHSLGIDTVNVRQMISPRRLDYEDLNALRKAADEGRLPHVHPHRYPDTRR